MKDQNLDGKFPKRNNFVKPLYKRSEHEATPTNENLAVLRSKTTKVIKLENEDGIDRNVKIYERNVRVDGGIIKRDESYYISEATSPGVRETGKSPGKDSGSQPIVHLSGNENVCELNVNFAEDRCLRVDKPKDLSSNDLTSNEKRSIRTKPSMIPKHRTNECWLRVLPAAAVPGEPCHAAPLRLMLCQLGLAAFLVLWSAAAAALLHRAEGLHEAGRVTNSTKQRKQLAVDLATELRQISVVSPSWLEAIERRLDEARRQAAADSSRARSAILWEPAGAALFAVLVMTLMGFGAPMPQTTLGRITALIYALLAIPLHFYMVANASKAFMSLMKCHLSRYRNRIRKASGTLKKHGADNSGKIMHHAGQYGCKTFLRNDPKVLYANKIRIWILSLLCSGRGLLLALTSYYGLGVLSFGVGRGQTYLDAMMFPLQFTTGGVLEQTSSVVRVCYAAYVEGAALLAACAWRAARERAASTLAPLADEYGLFSHSDRTLTS